MKASAVAHPIQGLIKYHGLRDLEQRIPFHDSISVCTAPTSTHTTVEFHQGGEDTFEIDGRAASSREAERAGRVVDVLRGRAGTDRRVRMVSRSNFPKYVGLGSSASGFAALSVAVDAALGTGLGTEALSEVARLGAGSATRSVAGGFAEWVNEGGRSFGRQLAAPEGLPWRTLVVLVRHDVPTEGVHRRVMEGPLFQARLAYLPGVLSKAREAIRSGDALGLMELAERDTLNLHAVTMTAPDGEIPWQGRTLDAMHAVRALRRGGTPCYFSIDTGATVYVNTLPEHGDDVRAGLERALPKAELLPLAPGPAARVAEDHLF